MKNQFSFSSTAAEVAAVFPNEISNRVFVITGGYGGIGAQAAIALLEQNATVVVAGRSDKSIAAFRQEHAKYGDRLRGGLLDLGDLQSVTRFANTLLSEGKPIDVLINNAGLMATPEGRTAQGHETQFGTNVIGHFLLSKLLLPLLKKSSQGGRIVWLSSVGHSIHGAARIDLDWLRRFKSGEQVKYDTWVRYQQSKLGDLLLGKAFHSIDGVQSASVHPGFIDTGLGRTTGFFSQMSFLFRNMTKVEKYKTPQQGASTTVLVAVMPNLQNEAYYADCNIIEPAKCAQHEDDVQALYAYCMDVTKEFLN